MNMPHDSDREIEEFLSGSRSALNDLYHKLPQPQPDAQLDRDVLKMARQAIADDAARPRLAVRPPPRRLRWPLALGSAASVVFAAGLALHLGMQNWQAQQRPPQGASAGHAAEVVRVRPLDMAPGATATTAPLPSPSPLPAPLTKPSPGVTAPSVNAVAPHARSVSVGKISPPPAAVAAPVTPPPQPAVQSTPAAALDAPAAAQSAGGAALAAPEAAAAPAAESARREAADKQQTKDERDAVERKLDLATGRDAALRARADATRAAPVGSPATGKADAVATMAAPMAPRPAPQRAPEPTTGLQDTGVAANGIAAKASSPAALPPEPDAWLRQIRARLQAGQREQAQRELREFVSRYPDYVLPAELRALLP